MANTGNKVSELPTAANVATTDRVMVLRDPAGNASVRTVTLANFANSIMPLVQNNIPDTTVTSNSITLASNGTSNVAFFSYTIGAGKTGCCDIQLHARDLNGHNISAGHILIVANTTAASKTETTVQIGSNVILFDPDPTLVSNTITVYFRRDSATTDGVNIRFSATIY
jgi:hypothetical protein